MFRPMIVAPRLSCQRRALSSSVPVAPPASPVISWNFQPAANVMQPVWQWMSYDAYENLKTLRPADYGGDFPEAKADIAEPMTPAQVKRFVAEVVGPMGVAADGPRPLERHRPHR